MKIKLLLSLSILLFSINALKAQEVDKYYLEDQIYMTLSYNMLVNKNDSVNQGGFSNGFSVGYIRDIPFNKRRNFGVAVGLGYSIGHYYQNLDIKTYVNGAGDITRLDSRDFIRNKFTLSYIEMPFEIRFRTSTIESKNFFRSYVGFKVGYRLNAYSKKKTNYQQSAYYNHPDFNWWRYGLTLNLGYSKWNLHVFYSLSEIFKDGTTANPKDINNSLIPLNMNELNIGLVFYLI
jgi:opacity protein-like surface antigen